jgi:hypothetical protein
MSSSRAFSVKNGVVLVAVVAALSGPGLRLQAQDKKADQKKNEAAAQAQAEEVQQLVRLADAAMTGQQVPSDFPIQFQNDFLKAQNSRVWVPITLTIDPAKLTTGALTLYLRVAPHGMTAPPAPSAAPAAEDKDAKKNDKDKNKKDAKDAKPAGAGPSYPFEDVSFLDLKLTPGQPLRIMRGVAVPNGSYDLYVVVRERAAAGGTPKAAVLKQPLDVPNYTTGEFATSTVLLAERVDQLAAPVTPEQQSERPYAFGQQEVIVSPDHKFKKDQELIVLFQIYNPVIADKKFNIEATYTFFQQTPDGEKKFNSTEPQAFTPESMGAAFDPSAPEQSIQAGQGIPLKSFPEGNYRLEIKVVDKLANPAKTLTQNVNFTVTP